DFPPSAAAAGAGVTRVTASARERGKTGQIHPRERRERPRGAGGGAGGVGGGGSGRPGGGKGDPPAGGWRLLQQGFSWALALTGRVLALPGLTIDDPPRGHVQCGSRDRAASLEPASSDLHGGDPGAGAARREGRCATDPRYRLRLR